MLNLVFDAWWRHRACDQPTYRAARFAPAKNCLTCAMRCLSAGDRLMILLVLLVRPTSRCRDVGDIDTDTALDSKLEKKFKNWFYIKVSTTAHLYVA